MLITYDEFKAIYGESAATETEFNLFAYQAERAVDNCTTGIDGIHKLRVAFPTDQTDAEAVKRCIADISSLLVNINRTTGDAGLSEGKGRVASKSSGSESISFSYTASLTETLAGDAAAREKTIYKMISSGLSGIQDANGVNLLYMGAYPVALKEGE